MTDFLVLSLTGLFTFIAGILLLKRETRLFSRSIPAKAEVVEYSEYMNERRITMYTMVVEYRLQDGTLVRAKEQKASSRRKYKTGSELEIIYSAEKPEMFNVRGDNSRKIIMAGMIAAGILLMGLSLYVLRAG